MNRILRNSLNIAKILFRSYCTMMVFFVDSSQQTWTMKGFFFLNNLCVWGEGWDLLWRNHWESEMKLGIYVPINVDTLMSVGNDSWFTYKLYGKNRLIFFRTNEQTLTRFGRTFPNEVWHSSHMISDILMVNIYEDFFLNNILMVLNEFCNTCIH
jgi:hypothetical protein